MSPSTSRCPVGRGGRRRRLWWVSDSAEEVLDEIEEFVTGVRPATPTNRVLASVMFTDIVSSTERGPRARDRRWRDLLDQHDAVVRRQLERRHGTEVNTTGDGFVAGLDGPAGRSDARSRTATWPASWVSRCAAASTPVRSSCVVSDIAGIAVHIAARRGRPGGGRANVGRRP